MTAATLDINALEIEIELTLRHRGDVIAVAEELAYLEVDQREAARLTRELGPIVYYSTEAYDGVYAVVRRAPYDPRDGEPMYAHYSSAKAGREGWSGSRGFTSMQDLVTRGLYRRA